jgi:hypothetical protein
MAISGRATLEITPQGIRFAREFLPQFIKRLKSVKLRLGSSLFVNDHGIGTLVFHVKGTPVWG